MNNQTGEKVRLVGGGVGGGCSMLKMHFLHNRKPAGGWSLKRGGGVRYHGDDAQRSQSSPGADAVTNALSCH